MYQKNSYWFITNWRRKEKRHYVLIKNFDTFMYDHHGKEEFCPYCLQAFSIKEIFKSHIKDCFKTDGKQRIKMPKKGEFVKFKIYKRKTKPPFIFYADFESILVPENNGKENPEKPFTNKCQ